MRGKVVLIAAVLLLVVAGGAAGWVAANDDDDASTELFSDAPERRDPAPDQGSDDRPATPPSTTTTEQPHETLPPETEPRAATPRPPRSSKARATPKRKTHFERERRKPNNDAPQRRFAVPPAREFSGEGNAHLGTVDVKTTAVLRWSAKGRLEIRFGPEAFPIVAPTKSGQLVLPPYRFEQVRVIAASHWKLTIRPR